MRGINLELVRASCIRKLGAYSRSAAFGYIVAGAAYKKGAVVVFIGVLAANIGVETVDFVYQPVGLKKVQSAINSGWGGGADFANLR